MTLVRAVVETIADHAKALGRARHALIPGAGGLSNPIANWSSKSASSTLAFEVRADAVLGLLSLANKVLEIRIGGEAVRDAADRAVAVGEEFGLYLL